MPTHSTPQPSGYQQDDGAASRDDAAPGSDAPSMILDPRVLRDMRQDFSDTGVVPRFARDFSTSLGDKLDRLDLRLRDGDTTGARDAAISLSISADMIGAGRLGDAARAARITLGTDASADSAAMELLRACAADTLRQLELTYPGSV